MKHGCNKKILGQKKRFFLAEKQTKCSAFMKTQYHKCALLPLPLLCFISSEELFICLLVFFTALLMLHFKQKPTTQIFPIVTLFGTSCTVFSASAHKDLNVLFQLVKLLVLSSYVELPNIWTVDNFPFLSKREKPSIWLVQENYDIFCPNELHDQSNRTSSNKGVLTKSFLNALHCHMDTIWSQFSCGSRWKGKNNSRTITCTVHRKKENKYLYKLSEKSHHQSTLCPSWVMMKYLLVSNVPIKLFLQHF